MSTEDGVEKSEAKWTKNWQIIYARFHHVVYRVNRTNSFLNVILHLYAGFLISLFDNITLSISSNKLIGLFAFEIRKTEDKIKNCDSVQYYDEFRPSIAVNVKDVQCVDVV